MPKGFVFGKFLPFHKGHQRLIDYAISRCDQLDVIVCSNDSEAIPGPVRVNWISVCYVNQPKVQVRLVEYCEDELSSSSESSRDASRAWAAVFKRNVPDASIVFTSEPYGDYVAQYMGIEHHAVSPLRDETIPSGTQIRGNPFIHWDALPDIVRPHFVRKVVVGGTESTGKTTLVKNLARHFETNYVAEAARDIVVATGRCTFEDLQKVVVAHAIAIQEALLNSNRLLFIDTDVHTTISYGQFLFGRSLSVPEWAENVNAADDYFFLDNDVEFVQDGTRLSHTERDRLHLAHLEVLKDRGVDFSIVSGNWQERFDEVRNRIRSSVSAPS